MSDDHSHHDGPSRCCPEEAPEQVLEKLRRFPPQRMGYQTPNGWSGESEQAFGQRMEGWRMAVAREEAKTRGER